MPIFFRRRNFSEAGGKEIWQGINPEYQDMDLIFCRPNGKPLDPNNLAKRGFQRAISRAGVKRIRLHDLRHTFATLLIAQGENLKYIQSQMGHSSIQTTMDLYGHLLPDANRDAGAKLDKAIFG